MEDQEASKNDVSNAAMLVRKRLLKQKAKKKYRQQKQAIEQGRASCMGKERMAGFKKIQNIELKLDERMRNVHRWRNRQLKYAKLNPYELDLPSSIQQSRDIDSDGASSMCNG